MSEGSTGRWVGATWWLVGLWLVARLAYLRWACPYELFGDEANFWEWTRYPALSYYSAGPGMMWLLWPWVKLLGDHEWVVRIPAALSIAATALLLAGLARELTVTEEHPRGDARVGFAAAAACLLMPGFHLWSQIMTYDGPYTALWVAAAWAGWRALERRRIGDWALVGLALGAGLLLKYTAVLLVPGLVGYAWLWRRDRLRPVGLVTATGVMALCALPIIAWNAQHGWHLLTYLGAHINAPHSTGHTDRANPLWMPEFVVAQVLLAGPPLAALMIWGALRAARKRHEDIWTWRGMAFALWCGAPPLVFFLAVTPFAHAQANWALPGLAPPLIPAAWLVVRAWDERPVRRLGWGVAVWGLACAWLVSLPQVTARLPLVGRAVPMERFTGHSRLAREVEGAMEELRRETGREPFIVGSNYDKASLLAFYVRGHPRTYAAASYLGWRQNSYDFWPETDLRDPGLRGRPVVLVGGEEDGWLDGFALEGLRWGPSRGEVYVATGYAGLRQDKTR